MKSWGEGVLIWLEPEYQKTAKQLVEDISKEELWKHMVEFHQIGPKESGGTGEARAIEYVRHTLESYGVAVAVNQYDAYLSAPISAELKTLSPFEKNFESTPLVLSETTAPEGITGELVYVPSDKIPTACYKDQIILTEESGWLRRGGSKTAEKRGAKAIVVIDPDKTYAVIHQRADFSVWGAFTPETAEKIPHIAVVYVTNKDGEYLKKSLEEENVEVQVKAECDTGWKKLPLLIATIKGPEDPDKFVLIGGHIDTPAYSEGATDNNSGSSVLLELARVLHMHRNSLRRGVKIAWWSGHEPGRYSGSTWFNDNFWLDLRKNGLAYINIDSPGAIGATDYTRQTVSDELKQLAKMGIKEITGQDCETNRPGRGGDQSFLATGLPSMYVCVSFRPPEIRDPVVACSGGGWWWHTPFDTIDKADPNILHEDAKVHMHSLARLLNCPVLPMEFVSVADGLLSALRDLSKKPKNVVDLIPVIEKAEKLKTKADELESLKERLISEYQKENILDEKRKALFELINDTLMRLSRVLNIISYTDVKAVDQIPILQRWGFPGLQKINELEEMALPHSDGFQFLKTEIIRERNRVAGGFDDAIELVEGTLKKVNSLLGR